MLREAVTLPLKMVAGSVLGSDELLSSFTECPSMGTHVGAHGCRELPGIPQEKWTVLKSVTVLGPICAMNREGVAAAFRFYLFLRIHQRHIVQLQTAMNSSKLWH